MSSFGKKKPRRLRLVVLGLLVLPALAVGSWLFTDTAFHHTSGEEFCGGCHTMTPMVAAYREDVHGGAGRVGIKAECTDCHLDHSNSLSYFVSKSRFGIHDVWAQATYDLDAIDWEEKRSHRESFVFDSGCVKCHGDLERASERESKTFVAHRPYFLGTTESQCVSCHERVGHKDLSAQLAQARTGG